MAVESNIKLGKDLKLTACYAGPLFEEPEHFSFYNLELADTNVVDHNTHSYKKDGVEFCVADS